MALFCVISANSGSFRAHCVKVHVHYLISWWVLVLLCRNSYNFTSFLCWLINRFVPLLHPQSKTVRPTLSDRCPVLSVCPVCDVGALWPYGWMDQDETWHAGRPRPWLHCVRRGPSSPSQRSTVPPNFRPIYLLRPNCWMDQDATWYGGRPRLKRLCVRWRSNSPLPKRGRSPNFCDFVRTLHIRYWFVQVQLLVLYVFYF